MALQEIIFLSKHETMISFLKPKYKTKNFYLLRTRNIIRFKTKIIYKNSNYHLFNINKI